MICLTTTASVQTHVYNLEKSKCFFIIRNSMNINRGKGSELRFLFSSFLQKKKKLAQ